MDRVREALSRFRALFRRQPPDHGPDAKIAVRLEMAIEGNLRSGLSPEQARREALVSFRELKQEKQGHRGAGGLPALDALGQDLRYAFRTLRRDPVFGTIA